MRQKRNNTSHKLHHPALGSGGSIIRMGCSEDIQSPKSQRTVAKLRISDNHIFEKLQQVVGETKLQQFVAEFQLSPNCPICETPIPLLPMQRDVS